MTAVATPPTFHISFDGPAGMTFPSFPSSALEGGDTKKIMLEMIRNACNISTKLFFTVDGKSRVEDSTALFYYMQLTPEGQKILITPAAPSTATSDTAPTTDAVPVAGVATFVIRLADSTVKKDLVDIPGKNEALSKLVDTLNNSELAKGDPSKGTLPTFADRTLTSLVNNYATNMMLGRTYSYTEPVEMTESQWDAVLRNNRALHAYTFDYKLNTFVTARKPLFRLRGAAPVGKPSTSTTDAAPKQQYLPPVPPFYVFDNATVKVTEVRSQHQSAWIKEGFDSMSVGGSLGGGQATVPVSVEASWEQEHAYSNQTRTATDVQSLAVTYNFPRAVVELHPDNLEMTDQARREAMGVTTQAAANRFYQEYGSVFVTRFTLGGFLYSTRSVTSIETASLDQVKDKTRIAAGLSVQTEYASGGVQFAKVNSTSTTNTAGSLLQDSVLTWDAVGGDTLLCTNPPVWANSVKDHRLWRLMNPFHQPEGTDISVSGLLRSIDTEPWNRLVNPTSATTTSGSGRDVVTDEDFNSYVRVAIMDAFGDASSSSTSAIARKMSDYYGSNTASRVATSNAWNTTNFPDEGIIPDGKLFSALTLDQKVGWGMWMTSLGELTFA